ncbi:DUF952 domain-containing protein [Spirosoma aerophilum]
MGYPQKRTSKISVCLFVLLNLFTINAALAGETLYYLVKKNNWESLDKKASFRTASFARDGFIELVPREQVVLNANKLYPGQKDLLLLKIDVPFTDSLLHWDNIPGREASVPRYYGELPRALVSHVYSLKPNRQGRFTLPRAPFVSRLITGLIPDATVGHFLDYPSWQNTRRLYKLQKNNFGGPKVQLQWWYFDFFLADGSSVVLAFIPQRWWDNVKAGTEKQSMFTMALKTKAGIVKRFTKVIPQSEMTVTNDRLEIPSRLVIESVGSGADRRYTIQVNFDGITGAFTMMPTRPPFAAFPTGAMPGILMTLMSGADWGSPRFSYVSQIPDSQVSGSLTWGEYHTNLSGIGYHEQGRIDDTPERQGGSWMWYHFSGEGWSIFGSPGSYIYLQRGDWVIRAGFHAISSQYTLTNRTFASPDHAKILTGGQIFFRHENITFRLNVSPATTKTLVCYASATKPTEVWGTVGGEATLSISEGDEQKTVPGRIFLETCSWETRKGH